MASVFSEIYYGKYSVFNRSYDPESKYIKTLSAMTDLEDEIRRELTGALKEKFIEYARLSGEVNSAEGEDAFIEGFRLCARMMTEAFK